MAGMSLPIEILLPLLPKLSARDPLQELRHIRRKIEEACEERGQTYTDYLLQVQRKHTDRLVRCGPKPRLKVKEHRIAQWSSGNAHNTGH